MPPVAAPQVTLRYVSNDVLISCENLDDALFELYRRALDGAPWDPARRANISVIRKIVPILDRLRKIEGLSFLIDKPLAEAITQHTTANEQARSAADDRLAWFDEIASRRGLSMYGYQREGTRWLSTRQAALLADEMGLGKCAQSLAALPYGSAIVVCPASVRGTWKAEIAKWRPDLKAAVIETFRWPNKSEIVIFNYERLVDAAPLALYTQINPAPEGVTVIFDEAHYLKRFTTKRAERASALISTVFAHNGCAWLLTGTPLTNRPSELWSLLRLLQVSDELFGSYKAFQEMHNVRADKHGKIWGLASPEVAERLRRGMLRRRKRDVLTDLPDKIYVDTPVDVDMDAVRALDAVLAVLEERGIDLNDFDGALPDFHEMSRVRAQVAVGKIPAMLSIVETAEEEEQPLVVFSAHRTPIEVLAHRKQWGAILGGRDWFVDGKRVKDAQQVVDAFQTGKLRGIALTIGAGSTGVTLTRANHLVQVDLAWTPGDNDQATDRIHRIGQTRACQITQLVADHPLERRIAEVLSNKRRHIEASVNAAVSAPDADLVNEALATDTVISAMATQIADLCAGAFTETGSQLLTRAAETAAERQAAVVLNRLAATDGFRLPERTIGIALAASIAMGLTPSEWKLATKLAKKYVE